MLIPIPILIRESASDPPVESVVAVNPHCIARAEPSEEEGIMQWWADGMQGPRKTRMEIADFAAMVNSYCEGEQWTPDDSESE